MTGKERAEIALKALKIVVGEGPSWSGNDKLWLDVPLDADQVRGVEDKMNAFLMDQVGCFLITTTKGGISAYTSVKAVKRAMTACDIVEETAQMLNVSGAGIPAKVQELLDKVQGGSWIPH